MLGSTGTLFALIGLAMLSAGGIAYAVLFGRISSDNQTAKRIDQIQKRNPVAAAAAKVRVADTNKRRKSIQDTLKEMEDRQKAKAKQSTAPSLALRFQQAGLNWTKRGFHGVEHTVMIGNDADVAGDEHGSSAGGFKLSDRRLSGIVIAGAGDRHIESIGGQLLGHCQPDAATSTRH